MGSPFVKHNDTQHETSQYDDEHASDASIDHRTTHTTPSFRRGLKYAIPVCILTWAVLAAAGIWLASSRAQAGHAPEPIAAPAALLKARAACPNTATPVQCRAALRHAYEALAWTRKARHHEVVKVLEHTRGTQPYAYAARLAYMACISFSATPTRCRQPREMISVGRCESGLQSHDPNPTSTADGWMQYLDGTWNNSTAGQLGYSRYDILAMGIATEAIVHHDGGWNQWVCKP